jgi:hypothetical protein
MKTTITIRRKSFKKFVVGKITAVFTSLVLLTVSLPGPGYAASSAPEVINQPLNGFTLVKRVNDLVVKKGNAEYAYLFNTQSCPAYIFFGLRGSGEGFFRKENRQKDATPFYEYIDNLNSKSVRGETSQGIGSTLGTLFSLVAPNGKFKGKSIAAAAPSPTVGPDGTYKYQAPPVDIMAFKNKKYIDGYLVSVSQMGPAIATLSLYAISNACPSSKIILAGYSQGAMITSSIVKNAQNANSWSMRNYPDHHKNIRAAIVVADPANNKGLWPSVAGFGSNQKKALSNLPKDCTLEACGLLYSLSNMSSYLSSEFLQRYVTRDFTTPRSTTAMPIRSEFKAGDLVADFDKTSSALISCGFAQGFLKVASCGVAVGVAADGYLKHTSYDAKYFRERQVAKWLQDNVK